MNLERVIHLLVAFILKTADVKFIKIITIDIYT